MARVEHFAIYAADPAGLKDFYVKAFGLRVIVEGGGDPPGYFLADDLGVVAIEILGRPAGTTDTNQRWVCHLAFWVDDVPAKRAELQSMGIPIETETLIDTDDIKTAFFKDPGGNRCQIVWRRLRLTK
jgi:glyoxylase I family protein